MSPLFVWLLTVPYSCAATRVRFPGRKRVKGFTDIWSTMQVIAENPVLISMTVLVGAASFFVGNAYQAQMPGFALDLGHDRVDFSYRRAARGGCRRRLGRRPDIGGPGIAAAEGAHGIHFGDDLVLRAHRLCALEHLRDLDRAVVRGGIRGIGVQLHGSVPGADECARSTSEAG